MHLGLAKNQAHTLPSRLEARGGSVKAGGTIPSEVCSPNEIFVECNEIGNLGWEISDCTLFLCQTLHISTYDQQIFWVTGTPS